MEVKDLGLGELAAVSRSPRTLGEQPSRTYKQHSVDVNAVGCTGRSVDTGGTFVAADIFYFVLGLPGLT